MSHRAYVALLAGLLAVAPAWASPDKHVWVREILLGENEREHFYLYLKHANPGSEYDAYDSVFIVERSNTDPAWAQRTVLRATSRSTDPSTSQKATEDVADFDLPHFLVDHNCYAAFADNWPDSVAIDARGLCYREKGVRTYVLSHEELMSWMSPDIEEVDDGESDLSVVGLQKSTAAPDSEVGRIDYFLVRAGSGMDEMGQYEGIVPVPEKKVRAAMDEVRRELMAHKKPATKKR